MRVNLPLVYGGGACCSRYNLFGVTVFQRSMLVWRGSICHGYMCMLLYMQCIWCNNIPKIYAQFQGCQSAMGICACCSIWNWSGVMVFQTSMLNWRGCQSAMGICACCSICNLSGVTVFQRSMLNWRGGGQSALGICACCSRYNLFGVTVFQRSMLVWRGSICHGYMCMLLYMQCIWCNNIPKIYAQLQGCQSAMGICACCSIWNWSGVMVFQISMLNWRWCQSAMGICACCSICNLSGVTVFQRSMLNWRGEGQSALGICACCSRYNLFGVTVFQRSMLVWRGSICHGYMCMLLYMQCIWCNNVPKIYAQFQGCQSAMGICACCSIWNWSGVMVFQTSMLNWRGCQSAMGICACCSICNLSGVTVFQRSMLNWRGGGQSALGICACCSRYNLFGVTVFQRSMLVWRGSICHGYMCMLLYMQCIWCNNVPKIYAQFQGCQSAMGICACCSIWNWSGVMVFQTSMLNWRWCQSAMGICACCSICNLSGVTVFQRSMLNWRGGGQSALGICACCSRYNLFGVTVFQRSMLVWRGSICHGYMCMLLYMQCIWCNNVPKIYAQFQGCQSAMGICACCSIWNWSGVMVFQTSMFNWRGCQSAMGICACCSICNLSGVTVFQRSMLNWRGGGQSALGICACCSRYNLFGVTVFQRSMLVWRGSICHGYMCMLLYMQCIWCNNVPKIYAQFQGCQSAMGICACCSIWNWSGVMVFQTSMLNWRWCQSAMGICACCSIWNLSGVNVFQRIMLDWRGSVCHGYMCMLLYMKPISCNGIPENYAWLEGGQSVMGICACCSIWNWSGVMVFQTSMLNWRGCQSAMGICACCSIWNLSGVTVLQRSMLDWRGCQSAMGICACCSIWNLCGVTVFQISMLDWRRGWGQSAMKVMQHSGFLVICAQLGGVFALV